MTCNKTKEDCTNKTCFIDEHLKQVCFGSESVPDREPEKKEEHQVHENVKNDPIAMFASDEDLLIYDHFYRNGIASVKEDKAVEENQETFYIDFIIWYSGMTSEQIHKAYNRWLKERKPKTP